MFWGGGLYRGKPPAGRGGGGGERRGRGGVLPTADGAAGSRIELGAVAFIGELRRPGVLADEAAKDVPGELPDGADGAGQRPLERIGEVDLADDLGADQPPGGEDSGGRLALHRHSRQHAVA